MQTTAPTHSAIGPYGSPVQPSATNTRQVTISVAIVIPEIGFDEVPIRPVMRDDTVTKRKPKTMTRIAARKLPCIGIFGATARKIASSSDPPSTNARRKVALRAEHCAAAGAGAEFLQAFAGRRDDRRQRAAERDEAGGQHRAGADVSDVGAPELRRRSSPEIVNGWPVAGLFANLG